MESISRSCDVVVVVVVVVVDDVYFVSLHHFAVRRYWAAVHWRVPHQRSPG